MFFRSLRPQILKVEFDLANDLVVDVLRQVDAARFGQGGEPGRDVDTVAKNVPALGNDVAQIDPDAHGDPPLVGQAAVLFAHALPQRRGAAHCIDHAFELEQSDIASLLEDLSAVLSAQRRDDVAQNRPQLGEARDFVSRKQSAVTGDQDCRQTAPCSSTGFLGHHGGTPIPSCGDDAPQTVPTL